MNVCFVSVPLCFVHPSELAYLGNISMFINETLSIATDNNYTIGQALWWIKAMPTHTTTISMVDLPYLINKSTKQGKKSHGTDKPSAILE